MRDLGLRSRRHIGDAVRIDELDVIGIHREARSTLRDIVRDHEVTALRHELRLRVRDDIIGLGREPDEERSLALARLTQAREQVRIRDELDPHGLLRAALELLIGDLRRPKIRDRRRHHDDIGVLDRVVERPAELRGALDVRGLHADRWSHATRTEDQPYVRTAPLSGRRDRRAHLTGAAIADEPHRIDRFVRRPRGDDDLDPCEVLRGQHVRRRLDDIGRLGEPSRPRPTTREEALAWSHDLIVRDVA